MVLYIKQTNQNYFMNTYYMGTANVDIMRNGSGPGLQNPSCEYFSTHQGDFLISSKQPMYEQKNEEIQKSPRWVWKYSH